MTTAEVRTLFDYLKEHQAPLVKLVAGVEPPAVDAGPASRSSCRSGSSSRSCGASASTTTAWRLDPTVHPFASGDRQQRHPHHDALLRGHARRPVRDDARGRARPLRAPGRPTSSSARRSAPVRLARDARVAEPDVGEPRRPLAAVLAALLPAAAWRRSRTPFAGYDVDRWYREINAVQPSLIRVEADEATYNLHIILRFELEQELLDESFPLESLPEEWNRRMWELLGVEVPDDTRGVLQDTHWAIGAIGYFPTYALGNLISAQLWETDHRRPARPSRRASSAASSATCASGCASTSTATDGSSRRPRRSSGRSAPPRSTPSRTCAT